MPLFTASLNSGSNGNCYYVGTENEAVLIDAGISCRETERRMGRLGLSLNKVKAIFISHEHADHIKGLEVLSKKYNLPVYMSDNTYHRSGLPLADHQRFHFDPHETIVIGNLSVKSFPKRHDAADPCSFVVSGEAVNIGVMTDIGSVCDDVAEHFRQCNAVFIESNYDDDMLDNSHYPFVLKKRIKGDKGHLSNAQALELLLDHRSGSLSHVFLSHLSKENNSPELAQQLFQQYAGNTEVVVASRFRESAVYQITNDFLFDASVQLKPLFAQQSLQLKLF